MQESRGADSRIAKKPGRGANNVVLEAVSLVCAIEANVVVTNEQRDSHANMSEGSETGRISIRRIGLC